MSIWTAQELEQLDYVEIKTTKGAAPVVVRSPGVCTVTGDGIPRQWDVVNGYGISGANQRFKGLGLAEFEFTLRLTEPEHRPQFAAFDTAVEPSQPGKPEKVYEIANPRLALRGITKCVFLNAPILKDNGDGSDTATYKCRQWRKPLATLISPSAAGSSTTEGTATSRFQALAADRLATVSNRLQKLTGATP